MIESKLYRLAAPVLIPLAIACGNGESKDIAITETNPTSPGIRIEIDINRVSPILPSKPPIFDTSKTPAERVALSFEKEKDRNRIEDRVDTSKNPKLDFCIDWPVEGVVAGYFTKSHPLGIDIDTHDLGGTPPVRSAAKGRVSFAGGNPDVAYGNYIVIDHGKGIKTLYAHLSELGVEKGQQVDTKTIIGRAGKTGYAVGNHLHFELSYTEKSRQSYRYNPLDFLDQNILDEVCKHR